MAENLTVYEKAAIFDKLHSYFTDPMGRDDSPSERKIEELMAENERLREKNMLLAVDNRGIKACYDNLSEQYKELEAENAKLRLR